MERLNETLKLLREARAKTDACLVSFSGGKDSLIVMDLAVRTFARVEAYFMYFIPGLEVIETQLEAARKRWGVKIHQYPHWILPSCLKYSAFIPPSYRRDELPDTIKLSDLQRTIAGELGFTLLATGARRADSLWRRRMLNKPSAKRTGEVDLLYPIVGWTKRDVLAYLATQHIPMPPSDGGNATGIGLATPSLLWLHDNFPADFRKLCEVFPYAESVVWRRTWYGIS